jgi:hydroxymethylglutaryl-CoA lyase
MTSRPGPADGAPRTRPPSRVHLREVGPRDGLQLEAPLSFGDKARLLESLAQTGVRRIEAAAFVSARAVPSMADAEKIGEFVAGIPGIVWSALVAGPTGARRATDAGFRHIEYVVSASDSHSLANVGRTTAESVAAIGSVAGIVHAVGGSLEVVIATAWDCPFDGRTSVSRTVGVATRAVADGADTLCVADTIGTTVPTRVVALVDAVRQAAPDVQLGAHFHDTRGTGLASAWAAVMAGVDHLDASTGGLGGCPFAPGASGNIATEELVYLLSEAGVATDVDLEAVLRSARLTEEIVGHPVDSKILRAGGRLHPLGPFTAGGTA